MGCQCTLSASSRRNPPAQYLAIRQHVQATTAWGAAPCVDTGRERAELANKCQITAQRYVQNNPAGKCRDSGTSHVHPFGKCHSQGLRSINSRVASEGPIAGAAELLAIFHLSRRKPDLPWQRPMRTVASPFHTGDRSFPCAHSTALAAHAIGRKSHEIRKFKLSISRSGAQTKRPCHLNGIAHTGP